MVETTRSVLVTPTLSLLLTTPSWSEPVKLAVFQANDPAKLHRVIDVIARYRVAGSSPLRGKTANNFSGSP
ncbi:hypothetical protein [Desulfofustis glycolicus]|uniref:Uncharacterized protein n=1 Tax=Desulfofustis glycolicus DSM 9705 TaxID=1121409 RepID=A0A1M5TFZ6_9BACT|nr:hypothetical protein [Desulfofustis glycolicus]MCB2216386.1 hypothetical protein [Desulfobulbaceae bacterium]SHH49636.1 hypothetical protein SAMN02745124_00698 [Desulfofustis glycolicus DSM 9705]